MYVRFLVCTVDMIWTGCNKAFWILILIRNYLYGLVVSPNLLLVIKDVYPARVLLRIFLSHLGWDVFWYAPWWRNRRLMVTLARNLFPNQSSQPLLQLMSSVRALVIEDIHEQNNLSHIQNVSLTVLILLSQWWNWWFAEFILQLMTVSSYWNNTALNQLHQWNNKGLNCLQL